MDIEQPSLDALNESKKNSLLCIVSENTKRGPKRDWLNIFSILSLTFYNILGCLKDQITRLDALSKMQSKSWLFEINYFVKNKISAEKSQFFGPMLAINL